MELEKEMENNKEKEAETQKKTAANDEEKENIEASQEQTKDTQTDDLKRIEQLEKELSEQKDKYLRLMAEYDNYRKRTSKQLLEARESGVGDTILNVITVYDNFERAVETESQDAKYKEGIEMIYKQFTAALDKMNVKIVDPTGEPFDPAKANAVSQIVDENLGENVVAQVFEKGVTIGEKVIRYPTVVVANP
ncbi:MAG: nucleotide exchange factor GrpE [Ruminococcus sp.]|nr:nucleotide exchange factor GrpE [Ruminococcus sp.]